MHKTIHGAYYFSYKEIEEVEAFIKKNTDENFLVVTIPTTPDYNNVHFNAKVADTYLLYPNSFFAADKKINSIQNGNGIDLADSEIRLIERTDLRQVDYVVLTNEMIIDEEKCKPVIENRYFTVYQMNDPTKIPYMQRPEWGKEGSFEFKPKNGFASQYEKNGRPTFMSDETPAYVLYGPYATLPPGDYSITLSYSYSGTKEGRIGLMDLMGSTFMAGEYEAEAFSDQESVSISFGLNSECTSFEARLYAEVPGIQVESITVDYEAMEEAETEFALAA